MSFLLLFRGRVLSVCPNISMTLLLGTQAVHNSWAEPEAWRPERFLPGGEYSSFPESIRPFMARFHHNGNDMLAC